MINDLDLNIALSIIFGIVITFINTIKVFFIFIVEHINVVRPVNLFKFRLCSEIQSLSLKSNKNEDKT